MFPKTFIDKVECLQSLVGVRTGCTVDKEFPFWVEDIPGVDVTKLAKMAKPSNPNGVDVANQLINSASRIMIADLEKLINSGYRLKQIIGDMCSTCTLTPVYTANAGIIVERVVPTLYGQMKITRLNIMINATGSKQFVIDDGKKPEYFSANFIAGILMPIDLDYTTLEKSVKIKFTDPTVQVGQVVCTKDTGCGCGGVKNTSNPIHIKGLAGDLQASTQYGFVPCVAVDCSYESLVCNMIKMTPNIFGLALSYKFGELYYKHMRVSDRNNDAVAFNDEEGEGEDKSDREYARLYWANIKGTAGVEGLNKVVSNYLKTKRNDKCIICDSLIKTAYATG